MAKFVSNLRDFSASGGHFNNVQGNQVNYYYSSGTGAEVGKEVDAEVGTHILALGIRLRTMLST
jgi:hypothetical protein